MKPRKWKVTILNALWFENIIWGFFFFWWRRNEGQLISCHVNPLLPADISIKPLISLTCKHHSGNKVLVHGTGVTIKKKVLAVPG